MKRMISFALTMVMILAMVPSMAIAAAVQPTPAPHEYISNITETENTSVDLNDVTARFEEDGMTREVAVSLGNLKDDATEQMREDFEKDLEEMDEAEAAIESGDIITLTDPMLKGNLNQWIGYANALRLRMYLRLIDAGETSYTSKVQQLVNANNFFTGDVAWDVYSNAEGQYNPWYASKFRLGTNNHVAAYPIVAYYVATNDPRISYAIKKTEATGEYEGQIPGSKMKGSDWAGANWKNKDVSGIDYTPSIAMPVYMFTQSELQFLIAEAQLRFNNNEAAAKVAYEAGVAADFASRGTAGVASFLAGNKVSFDAQTSTQAKLNLIYQQKWAALFYRDHMEAWSEARRTGIPAQSAASAEQIYKDGSVYTAGDFIVPAQNYIEVGGLIKCVPYPSDARRLNKNMPEHVRLLNEKVFFGK